MTEFSLTTAPLAPGQCYRCGKSQNGHTRFVDWGRSVEFYGALYFCEHCALEMATKLLDVVPVSDNVKLAVDLTEALAARADLEEKVGALEHLLRAYFIDIPSPGSSSDGSEVADTNLQDAEEQPPGIDKSLFTGTSSESKSKSGTAKSTD